MSNWLKVLVISSIFIGCNSGGIPPIPYIPSIEIQEVPDANLDSLFEIGDSILAEYYTQQIQQQVAFDSMSAELCKKKEIEQRERIIYRDTVIYQEQVEVVLKTITDTIYDIVYITDTMNATVYVAEDKKKRKKKESQE